MKMKILLLGTLLVYGILNPSTYDDESKYSVIISPIRTLAGIVLKPYLEDENSLLHKSIAIYNSIRETVNYETLASRINVWVNNVGSTNPDDDEQESAKCHSKQIRMFVTQLAGQSSAYCKETNSFPGHKKTSLDSIRLLPWVSENQNDNLERSVGASYIRIVDR